MAELLVVSMLEPYELHRPFTIWPRHITIMPWFHADGDAVSDVLRKLASTLEPLTLRIGERSMFGAKHDVPVQLIEAHQAMHDLHETVMRALVTAPGAVIDGRYTGRQYRPHVTVKRGEPIPKGDVVTLRALQLAEALPQGYRQIVSDYSLEGVNEHAG